MTTVASARAAGAAVARRRSLPRIKFWDIVSVVWIVALLLFAVVPMLWMLSTSLKGDGQMKAVYTCGGGSRTPGLTEALGQRLRKPVELANPLATMSVREGALESLVTDEVAPLLMLSIGLALRKN